MIVSREHVKITYPSDAARHLHKLLEKEDALSRDREHFWVIVLAPGNRIKFVELVSLGTLNSTVVAPREVFRRAILKGASSLILAHSHPSGFSEPSEGDKELTKTLVEAGKIVGINVLDHVIIGKPDFSFKEEGLL